MKYILRKVDGERVITRKEALELLKTNRIWKGNPSLFLKKTKTAIQVGERVWIFKEHETRIK